MQVVLPLLSVHQKPGSAAQPLSWTMLNQLFSRAVNSQSNTGARLREGEWQDSHAFPVFCLVECLVAC